MHSKSIFEKISLTESRLAIKSFESAIVKLLSKQEEELNEDEKQNVTALLIKDGCPALEIVYPDKKISL